MADRDSMAELARKAIHEIRALTQDARTRARDLEKTPHRVPIPGFHWAARMTTAEVTLALGTKVPKPLPRHHDHEGVYYRAFEAEAFLQSLRVSPGWTVDRRDGTFQMLSETLLIAFRNSFHPGRAVYPLLVQPIFISHIADFLSGGGGTPSAFERFGVREPGGSFCRMTSHQFRHWLNYIADKGGLPIELQTRWMGREHSKDTEAYRHATVDERLEWVKAGIQEGKLAGPKASMYFELPRAKRDRYVDGEVQAVHFTALGLCLHDFAVTPCPYHLNCVRGCADYLRVKGSESERRHLVQIQQSTERALESAKARAGAPDGGVAEPWIRHCEETLEGVRAALGVDDEAGSAQAGVAQPFREAEQVRKDCCLNMSRPSVHDELKRRLMEHLAIAETYPPEDRPLDVRSVAAVLRISPTTLYKYGLNRQVNTAEQRQRENALISGAAIEQDYFKGEIRKLTEEIEKERERSKGLVGRIAIMEANAAKLGFDPEEMHKAILATVRTMSRVELASPGRRRF